MGSEKVDWAINGELALNCNCTVFCPCAVSLGDHPPTEGYCQTWLAVRIDNGHFRDVDLSGLRDLHHESVRYLFLQLTTFDNNPQ